MKFNTRLFPTTVSVKLPPPSGSANPLVPLVGPGLMMKLAGLKPAMPPMVWTSVQEYERMLVKFLALPLVPGKESVHKLILKPLALERSRAPLTVRTS